MLELKDGPLDFGGSGGVFLFFKKKKYMHKDNIRKKKTCIGLPLSKKNTCKGMRLIYIIYVNLGKTGTKL